MDYAGLTLGVILALLGLLVWWHAGALWQQSGLPEGEVVQGDMGGWFRQKEPLYAADLGLGGRPDYLVRDEYGSLVPVELKSSTAPPRPHPSHVLQLAAYCLLVERAYGQRPSHGILQYRDRAFAIDYNETLEADLLDILAEMRADLFEPSVDRDHDDARRCARCGVRQYCDQRLA